MRRATILQPTKTTTPIQQQNLREKPASEESFFRPKRGRERGDKNTLCFSHSCLVIERCDWVEHTGWGDSKTPSPAVAFSFFLGSQMMKRKKEREERVESFFFVSLSLFHFNQLKNHSQFRRSRFPRCARTRGGSTPRRQRETHRGCSPAGARGRENGWRGG